MISAIDRSLGFRGGETLALMTIGGLGVWIGAQHVPYAHLWYEHARLAAASALTGLRACL